MSKLSSVFMPKPRKTRRQRIKVKYRTRRRGAREAAYARDGGRCRFPSCRRIVALETEYLPDLAHGHEIGGGRSKVDPTDPAKIVTVCQMCHSHLHVRVGGKLKRIEGDDANAALRYYERASGRADWRELQETAVD